MARKQKQTVEFGRISGNSIEDAHFIVIRFVGKYDFSESESWVMQAGPNGHSMGGGHMTGVWRSPRGRVLATSGIGKLYTKADPGPSAPWSHVTLDATLTGVWGLDDDLVFAWGTREAQPKMFLFDGTRWEEIEAPGKAKKVFTGGMHGISRDLIYAVGGQGTIARWDGAQGWKHYPSPLADMFTGIWVESDTEMYCSGGTLLQGSVHGWVEVLQGETQMTSVAKWRGDVYVAATELGLARLDGNRLQVIKDGCVPQFLDARGDLVVSCVDRVMSTKDAKNFTGYNAAMIGAALK